MAWAEIAKVVAEATKEGAKETAKQTAKEVGKSAKALDARKPVDSTNPKGERLKPFDNFSNQINLDKRIPQDIFKIKNNTFEVNGYKYTTDKLGRTTSAEGKLRIDPSERDLNAQKKAGGKDRLKTDDGGHPIGSQFGGAGDRFLIPQDATLNRGPYKALESKWASAIKNGDKVFAKVDMNYPGKSMRPDRIRVTYSINGEKFKTSFSNKPNAYAR